MGEEYSDRRDRERDGGRVEERRRRRRHRTPPPKSYSDDEAKPRTRPHSSRRRSIFNAFLQPSSSKPDPRGRASPSRDVLRRHSFKDTVRPPIRPRTPRSKNPTRRSSEYLLPPDHSRRWSGAGSGSRSRSGSGSGGGRTTPNARYGKGQREDRSYREEYQTPADNHPKRHTRYDSDDSEDDDDGDKRQTRPVEELKHLALPQPKSGAARSSMTTTILPGESRVRDSVPVAETARLNSTLLAAILPATSRRPDTWHFGQQDKADGKGRVQQGRPGQWPTVQEENEDGSGLIDEYKELYNLQTLPIRSRSPSPPRRRGPRTISKPMARLPSDSRALDGLLEHERRGFLWDPALDPASDFEPPVPREGIDTLHGEPELPKQADSKVKIPKILERPPSASTTDPALHSRSEKPNRKQTPVIEITHAFNSRLNSISMAIAQLERGFGPDATGYQSLQQQMGAFNVNGPARAEDAVAAALTDRSQDIRHIQPGNTPPERLVPRNRLAMALRPRIPSNISSGPLSDKSYMYSELEWREIRLIKVLPARMAAIRCELIHASLDSPPSYIAISYAWGDAADTKKIQLHGNDIFITSSLYGALDALRQKKEPVLVWADALCINQQDRDERTQQVQLMTSIYNNADSVSIWLGQESDESSLAIDFLGEVAAHADSTEEITRLIASRVGQRDIGATVSLFERDYWRRLWVVQEVFNAPSTITVYCGSTSLPWSVYTRASEAFRRHKADLDNCFPGGANGGANDGQRHMVSQNQLTYSQVLVHQGPGSLSDVKAIMALTEGQLLEVLRTCRRKLAADPRDKVFGILGVLPEDVREDFQPDYSLSVKEVYTNVVDYLLSTTERLDVICEAIYFPLHTALHNLPSWVPDWSHVPQTSALGLSYNNFTASGTTSVDFKFADDRRNKLEITAIPLDTIHRHGIAVGTLCALADFLMAFLHWRALLLAYHDDTNGPGSDITLIQEAFCRTLCLDQVPPEWSKNWPQVVHHLFASLLRSRLPHIPLDANLQSYLATDVGINPDAHRRLLQEHMGARMMGRCFCLTKEGCLGMGSGFMAPEDLVVVPLGCYTPVLLRPEGRGEYRLVGDVYIHGYMRGKAVDQWREGKRQLEKFVIH